MYPSCKTLGTLAAAATLVAGNASAEIETKIHTGYTSQYLWRGLDLGNDLIETGVDVSTEWNGLALSAGAWYAGFEAGGEHVDELDLYAEVAKDFGFVKGSIGYIAYLYPKTGGDTYQELYFGLARDLGFATASLKYFWDVQGDNDGYSELGLTKSYELKPGLSLTVDSNIGYLIEQGQATAWTSKLTLDWSFAEHFKLSPFVAASLALSDDGDTLYAGSHNELVAGSMLSFTF
jgi:uncharacterized protein (TIGR02001 family)